ncbi:Glycosyltransferase family 69 protein [Mycena venus]|uniref:Glycosyltransferase family 69 protein n=1 Tax=Mycena venus TaxID=2733690 RepID=A0A8H6XDR5_9AGAR|nr:Glycosyltransferase family 69 protein [Mycena venus]
MNKVIHCLGPDNVFVSIFEFHLTDAMPTFLHSFKKALLSMGVPHRILTQDTWITQPGSRHHASTSS